MLVYWFVWSSVVFLAAVCQSYDFTIFQSLTVRRIRHKNSVFLPFMIASAILVLFAGCRYYVGTDFGGYYRFYKKYLDLIPSLLTLGEPGIRLIYTVASAIHSTGGMCIFCVAAVTLSLELSVLYKNTNNIGMALALFVFTCWTSCFNGVRQALATAVLFCGLPALRDRDFKKYAIMVFLAFLCHRSAIVMILVYFMIHRKADTKNVVILILASTVVLLSYDIVYQVVNIVLDNDVTGEESYWSTSVNILRVLTDIVPAAFFLFLYRSTEKTPAVSFYLNLLLIHAVVGLTTANSACLARMVMYTMPFAVIAMSELIKILPTKKRRWASVIIVVLYFIMEFYECASSDSLNTFRVRWFW